MLCSSSSHLHFVLRILCTSCFLIGDGLGDDEDIDRFVMSQGMVTQQCHPVCRFFELSYRIDFNIEISPYVTGFTTHGFYRLI